MSVQVYVSDSALGHLTFETTQSCNVPGIKGVHYVLDMQKLNILMVTKLFLTLCHIFLKMFVFVKNNKF